MIVSGPPRFIFVEREGRLNAETGFLAADSRHELLRRHGLQDAPVLALQGLPA